MYVCMYARVHVYMRAFIDRMLQQINLLYKNFTYKMCKRLWYTFFNSKLKINFKIKNEKEKAISIQ